MHTYAYMVKGIQGSKALSNWFIIPSFKIVVLNGTLEAAYVKSKRGEQVGESLW